jgi:pimeloyl-ACP methyl ester carboxylesterase
MLRRSTLAGLAGAAGLAAAGGVLAQRRLRRAIGSDPDHELLFGPLGGERVPVASAEGSELHVRAFGPADAPKLILVHGWMCSLEYWRFQFDELAREFRVIAYDQRGHGGSAPARDYSFESFAADLGCVLDACVPDGERALVAAHSMGAMTVVAWAGRHPDRVSRRVSGTVLQNTGLGDLITEAVLFRTPRQLDGLKDPLGRLLMTAEAPIPPWPSPITDAAVRYVAMNPGAGAARVAFCRRMLLSSNPDVRGAAGRAMARMDLWHAIDKLTVPTAVIAGELDKLTPPVHARKLADKLPDLVDFIELPRVGHMAAIEAPEAINKAIGNLANQEGGTDVAGPASSAPAPVAPVATRGCRPPPTHHEEPPLAPPLDPLELPAESLLHRLGHRQAEHSQQRLARKRPQTLEGGEHIRPLILGLPRLDERVPDLLQEELDELPRDAVRVAAQLLGDRERDLDRDAELRQLDSRVGDPGTELLEAPVAEGAQEADPLRLADQSRIVSLPALRELPERYHLRLLGRERLAQRAGEPKHVHAAAVRVLEQAPDRLQVEPVRLELLDQLDPGLVLGAVEAGPALHLRRWQEPTRLVGADVSHGHPGALRQLVDLEALIWGRHGLHVRGAHVPWIDVSSARIAACGSVPAEGEGEREAALGIVDIAKHLAELPQPVANGLGVDVDLAADLGWPPRMRDPCLERLQQTPPSVRREAVQRRQLGPGVVGEKLRVLME